MVDGKPKEQISVMFVCLGAFNPRLEVDRHLLILSHSAASV